MNREDIVNFLEWLKMEPEFNIDDVNEIADDYMLHLSMGNDPDLKQEPLKIPVEWIVKPVPPYINPLGATVTDEWGVYIGYGFKEQIIFSGTEQMCRDYIKNLNTKAK